VNEFVSNIPYAEKVRIYSYDYLKTCKYLFRFNNTKNFFTKKLFSQLIASSQLLEDFLDFHGAKNNQNWYAYREYAASVRHLSLGGYSQKHILHRMEFYDLPNTEDFIKQGEATLDFLTGSLMKLAPIILKEAERLQIPIPEKDWDQDYFPTVVTNEMLEFDIDDDTGQEKSKIVKIASEFLTIAGNFDQLGFYEPYDLKGMLEMVPKKVNEVEIRRFEMLVHNLQSSFDTYVIQGGYRYGNRKLKQLRSYFSVVFHILQIVGRLLHFYERHLLERGHKRIHQKARNHLSELIDPATLLDRTINYGLYYACHFLTDGKEFASEILNENIERSSIDVPVPVKLGFHSRPSLLVAKIVQYYGGQVELCVGDNRFDASSVLDIQWAGGKIHKENITRVTFEGDARALKDIEILADVNYGEDTMGKGIRLPKELNYLR
jgi:hypothetical protein